MSRTFVEALREKYCGDDDDSEGNPIVNIVYVNRPRRTSGSSDSAGDDVELAYLKNVVLCNTSIRTAGIPSNGLSSLCPNVKDLDLSSNSISDWNEVLSVFTHLPSLQFVNLSRNPLGGDQQNSIPSVDKTFGIEDLVLNNTQMSWDQALALVSLMPSLQELHLCQNGYTDVATDSDQLCKVLAFLKCLRLNENELSRWEDIAKLGHLPELHTLILSDNPLQNIHPAELPLPKNSNQDDAVPSTEFEVSNDEKVDAEGIQPEQGSGSPHVDEYEVIVSVVNENNSDDNAAVIIPENVDSALERSEDNMDRTENDISEVNIPKKDEDMKEDVESSLKDTKETKFNIGKSGPKEDMQYNNGISAIHEGDENCVKEEVMDEDDRGTEDVVVVFPNLSVLCVSNTKIASWRDIDALRTYPKLTSVKIRNIPLHQDESEEDRRHLFVASLPKVKKLNGSEVTQTYLDKSEIHFIRFFGDKPDPPKRYTELVQKHGELTSLAAVDMGKNFQEFAKLSFIYGGRCIHKETIRVVEPVGILKNLCGRLIGKRKKYLRIYYLAKSRAEDNGRLPPMEELCLETLPMSRYDMMDGDEIHIDVTSKPQSHLIKQSFQTSTRPAIS